MHRSNQSQKRQLSILIANPSADVYGSDLQMLESVGALVAQGHRVVVLSPDDGPLMPMLQASGARTELLPFPVVRRSYASASGMLRLVGSAAVAIRHLRKAIRRIKPDLIYVNTMTIPWWSAAARITRVPVLVHVHEAEADDHRLIRFALNAPLLLANRVIVNSSTSLETMTEVIPRLSKRAVLIHNGVKGPSNPLGPFRPHANGTHTAAIIGRLSPRKATDIALQAVSRLRSDGMDLDVMVAGSAFEGYEWFVKDLEQLAESSDLSGAVEFLGYVEDVWPVLERADVVLAPSVRESLGNAVIEAQLAGRPVVATATSGHLESVDDGESGLLVPVGDVEALAAATRRVLEDTQLAARLASSGRLSAQKRFSSHRYNEQILGLVESMAK